MARIFFRSVPFDKNSVTLALEAGVDGLIVPEAQVAMVSGLARSEVWPDESVQFMELASKADEEAALQLMKSGNRLVLKQGWEIIPIENLLAQTDNVFVEADSAESAQLAGGILERGVTGIVAPAHAIGSLREIVGKCKLSAGQENLSVAKIISVRPVGLGHRVCLDTMTLMHKGQGMLVGNSSAFAFLVHAETEHNEYVASRPFRVNAGSVHAYVRLPHDRTTYLGELTAGEDLLVVDYTGETSIAVLGRVKIEIRPMLLIEAEAKDAEGLTRKGSIFLQNAETIRLTGPDGAPKSVVTLQPGDEVLCRLDQAGRHFGMRVKEEIKEV